jgi:hypothetical protein
VTVVLVSLVLALAQQPSGEVRLKPDTTEVRLKPDTTAVRQQADSPCQMGETDRAWLQDLLTTWRTVAREALRIDPDPLPTIVLFDQRCVWTGDDASGTAHDGNVPLPTGESIAARLATFAGTYDEGDRPFVVMAMPSVWRAEPRHQSEADLPLLMRAVFAHEMAHTAQSPGIGLWLREIERGLKPPQELDDDIIQTRFEKNPEFRATWAAERSLLYQAANETNDSLRRALLSTALAMMETRRARFFTGDDAVFAELEDVFLNMEGVGQWAAYQVALRSGLPPLDAQNAIRRGRTRWSQEEGLAAFLLIDALVPDWRDRVLKGKPASVFALLAEAARRP